MCIKSYYSKRQDSLHVVINSGAIRKFKIIVLKKGSGTMSTVIQDLIDDYIQKNRWIIGDK